MTDLLAAGLRMVTPYLVRYFNAGMDEYLKFGDFTKMAEKLNTSDDIVSRLRDSKMKPQDLNDMGSAICETSIRRVMQNLSKDEVLNDEATNLHKIVTALRSHSAFIIGGKEVGPQLDIAYQLLWPKQYDISMLEKAVKTVEDALTVSPGGVTNSPLLLTMFSLPVGVAVLINVKAAVERRKCEDENDRSNCTDKRLRKNNTTNDNQQDQQQHQSEEAYK